MNATQSELALDSRTYRQVLGQYPTGVCVITADTPSAGRAGMVIGSFTSVSLDPPLVAFFPARTSTTWPKISEAGRFCVNILGADQEEVCRTFFAGSGDKFANIATRPAGSGSPIIEGALAWIDCEIEKVEDAGDHFMVMGRVLDLATSSQQLPLVFFQGGYGKFSPLSMTAPDVRGDLAKPLRHVDIVRPLMEQFVRDFDCRCMASAQVADEVVLIAGAGQSRDPEEKVTLVGQRMPYAPPMGSVFAAFDTDAEVERWLKLASDDTTRDRDRNALATVRERGVSVALKTAAQRAFATRLESLAKDGAAKEGEEPAFSELIPKMSYDPPVLDSETYQAVRQVSAPVFDADGSVAFALTAFGFGRPRQGMEALTKGLLEIAATATARIGGRAPEAHQ